MTSHQFQVLYPDIGVNYGEDYEIKLTFDRCVLLWGRFLVKLLQLVWWVNVRCLQCGWRHGATRHNITPESLFPPTQILVNVRLHMLVHNICHRWRRINHHRPIICAQRQRIILYSVINGVFLVSCLSCCFLLLIIGDLFNDTSIDRVDECGINRFLFVLGKVLTAISCIGHNYFGDIADVERRVPLNV